MRHPGGRLNLTRKSWFIVLEDLYDRTRPALLSCHQGCPNLLCETADAEQVLFLPYELEYIQDQLGLLSNPFETVRLGSLTYGFMSGKRDCPFFQAPECRIHTLRPFDCRSFPILPKFTADRSVEFLFSAYCPLAPALEAGFVRLFTACWEELAPRLPQAWKDYYNAHCNARTSQPRKP